MKKPAILRLDPSGPLNGRLTKLELSQEDFQSDLPEQHWHIYFQDEQLGLTVGVWTTTSMQEAFGPYPWDEFMIVLEGQVKLLDHENQQSIVKQGETFVVSKGLPVSWKQEGFCRKFFLIYDPPDALAASAGHADGGQYILKSKTLEPMLKKADPQQQNIAAAGSPSRRQAVCDTKYTGNMMCGLAQDESLETAMAPSSHHELVQLLTGKVQVTEAGGHVHEFRSGDVFFLPAGTPCAWRANAPTSRFFCRVDPDGQNLDRQQLSQEFAS